MKRRVVPTATDNGKPAAETKSEVLKGMKHILQHLTATAYDDGAVREVGWIQLKVDRGEWTIRMSDPDAGASMTVRAPSVDLAFGLAEALLGDAKAPWQPDDWLLSRKKKKRR